MKRDYKLYINDIRESVALIEEYIKDTSEKEFIKNKQLQDSVIRRLETSRFLFVQSNLDGTQELRIQ